MAVQVVAEEDGEDDQRDRPQDEAGDDAEQLVRGRRRTALLG
jgi:hypothetical protein